MAKDENAKRSRNRAIKKASKAGESTREIGRKFNISNKRVSDIVHRDGLGENRARKASGRAKGKK